MLAPMLAQVGDAARSPGFYATPIPPAEELSRQLNLRVDAAIEDLKASRDWRESPGEDVKFSGSTKGRLYYSAVSSALRGFMRENFLKTGVRFLAGAEVNETTEALSNLTAACLGRALKEACFLLSRDVGEPSSPAVWLVSGSFGRGELLPNSDLDMVVYYETTGETKGVARPATPGVWAPPPSRIPNEDFFVRACDTADELMNSETYSTLHMRGPWLPRELESASDMSRGLQGLIERMNLLNLMRVHALGEGAEQRLQEKIAALVFNPEIRHETILAMIRSQEAHVTQWTEVKRMVEDWEVQTHSMKPSPSLENAPDIKAVLSGGGEFSLKFGLGGERALQFMAHVGQLLDPTPEVEKLVKPNGVVDGLRELTKTNPSHPFHLAGSEYEFLAQSFNSINRLNILLRLRFPDIDVRFNPFGARELRYASEFSGKKEGEYLDELASTLSGVHRIWTRCSQRFIEEAAQ
jgi:hypothetical protein